jgi:ferredoxin-nitrite reductase
MTPAGTPRPAPDRDLVLKRNSVERLKQEKFPPDIRDDLPALIATGYEAIPEEDIVRLGWWGLTHDKPKTGTFMVRIKVPGGLIQPPQLRAVGHIARAFGQDYAELTTRQGIQLHGIRLNELPGVLTLIEAAGLTTAGGEGDTVRNITGCPVAGISPAELFGIQPTIEAAARFFNGNSDYSDLPRKHKYTISACPAQCNAPEINDVALVGMLRDGQPGFAVRVGGGLANTPRFSRDLGVFVPQPEAIEVLCAVTDVWRGDLRYRVSRARARLKFMVDDYGPEAFRAMVEDRLGRRLPDGTVPEPGGPADHLGVHPQRQPGFVYAGIPVPAGQVTGTQLESLADLLEGLGADLRFTRQQNVVTGSVPVGRLGELRSRLADAGLPPGISFAYGRAVACTSHQFCNYSVAETKEKLREVLGHLERRFGGDVIARLGIHMDGCPHACGQHWIGEIGLQGTTAPSPGGQGRIEAYDVSVGGSLGKRAAIGRTLLRRVPSAELAAVLERLVEAWSREGGHLSFGEFCQGADPGQLAAIASGTTGPEAVASEPSACGVMVRIPGPLLETTGGNDNLIVQANTVRQTLALVGRQYPRFAERVTPCGQLDKSFAVFVGEEDVRWLQGLDTPVAAGDEITILAAIAGG